MKREALENTVTTGKINGRRDRGRARVMMMGGLGRRHRKIASPELFQGSTDRDLWTARRGSGVEREVRGAPTAPSDTIIRVEAEGGTKVQNKT